MRSIAWFSEWLDCFVFESQKMFFAQDRKITITTGGFIIVNFSLPVGFIVTVDIYL